MSYLRIFGPILVCALCAECGSDPHGIQLHIGVNPQALGALHKVTLTLSGPDNKPLGSLDHAVSESGIVIHTDNGKVILDLVRGSFDLRQQFDVVLVPTGDATDVSIAGEMFNVEGDLLGSGSTNGTVHADAAELVHASLHLDCALNQCAPMVIGQLTVRPDVGMVMQGMISTLEAQVFPSSSICTSTAHGIQRNGNMPLQMMQFPPLQKFATFTLEAGKAYTAYVRALDGSGKLIAAGCASTLVSLPPRANTEIDPVLGEPDELIGDTCADPINIPTNAGITNTVMGSLFGASDDFVGGCGGSGTPDRVFTFNLANPQHINLVTTAAFEHALYLRGPFTGGSASQNCMDTSRELRCTSHTLRPDLVFDALAPGTYYVFVDGDPGTKAPEFQIAMLVESAGFGIPVPGDNCQNATPLPSTPTLIDNTLAQDDIPNTLCNMSIGSSYEMIFTVPTNASSHIHIDVDQATFTPIIGLQASCGGAKLGCAGTTTPSSAATLDAFAVPAGNLYAVIEGPWGQSGTFRISGYARPGPPNDQCWQVQTLTPGMTVTGSLQDAGDDRSGSCGGAGNNDVVYMYTTTTPVHMVVTVTSSDLPPVVYLTQRPCTLGPEVSCVTQGAGSPAVAVLDVPNLSAGEYYIWVDSSTNAGGSFTIRVDEQ